MIKLEIGTEVEINGRVAVIESVDSLSDSSGFSFHIHATDYGSKRFAKYVEPYDKIIETDAAYRARICTLTPYVRNDVALQTAIGRDLDALGALRGFRRQEQTRAEAYDDYNRRHGAVSVKVDPGKSYRKGEMVFGVYDPKTTKLKVGEVESKHSATEDVDSRVYTTVHGTFTLDKPDQEYLSNFQVTIGDVKCVGIADDEFIGINSASSKAACDCGARVAKTTCADWCSTVMAGVRK